LRQAGHPLTTHAQLAEETGPVGLDLWHAVDRRRRLRRSRCRCNDLDRWHGWRDRTGPVRRGRDGDDSHCRWRRRVAKVKAEVELETEGVELETDARPSTDRHGRRCLYWGGRRGGSDRTGDGGGGCGREEVGKALWRVGAAKEAGTGARACLLSKTDRGGRRRMERSCRWLLLLLLLLTVGELKWLWRVLSEMIAEADEIGR
jgi:hypothetical protein